MKGQSWESDKARNGPQVSWWANPSMWSTELLARQNLTGLTVHSRKGGIAQWDAETWGSAINFSSLSISHKIATPAILSRTWILPHDPISGGHWKGFIFWRNLCCLLTWKDGVLDTTKYLWAWRVRILKTSLFLLFESRCPCNIPSFLALWVSWVQRC